MSPSYGTLTHSKRAHKTWVPKNWDNCLDNPRSEVSNSMFD